MQLTPSRKLCFHPHQLVKLVG